MPAVKEGSRMYNEIGPGDGTDSKKKVATAVQIRKGAGYQPEGQ